MLTKKQKRQLANAVFGLAIIVAIWIGRSQGWIPENPAVEPAPQGFHKVVSFTDGDTLTAEVDGKRESVRLIGVDTPEIKDPRKPVQCFAQAASEFTESLIGDSSVRLEADPLNSDRDRYDRILRYVYLPDGRLVNSEIIRQGYGFAYTNYPFQKMDEFRMLEKEARDQKLGLWASC